MSSVCAPLNRHLALLLICAFLGANSVASAQPKEAGKRVAGVFSVHDIDADGYLNRLEYKAFLEQRRRRHTASGRPARHFRQPLTFSEIDANGDQYISEQELTTVLGQRLRQRKHHGTKGHD